ncbi:hypothetical protein DZF91_36055 [Actinomadura logoneensis]|uniref:Uncharacterized protein n=1 Tax=Actinomadura logoneensis TaxID=2293572 RepID=A0A372JA03_9ACTN|nr:hypothetical protein [Actinomadura logoneensis]RFU36827.1 hypothetical protein DZF91_36055 [Actinomadura logoneensis]
MRERALGAGVVGLALAVLLAGCGSGGDGGRADSSASLPLMSRVSDPPPPPKDGTNLAACREGRCEVRVRAGDQIELAPHFHAGPLVITAVEPDGLSVRWTYEGGGSGAGKASPNSTITFGDGGTLLTIHVERIGSDSAVIRLMSGEPS